MEFWLIGTIVLTAWIIFSALSLPGLKRAVVLTNVDVSPQRRSEQVHDPQVCFGKDLLSCKPSPKVSVILAGKNEAENLPNTLSSLKSQTWSNMEVIVVDDRSTDDTLHILETAAKTWSHLKVIHNEKLPQGWLGKTYALWTAARKAKGSWLLFTDADVSLAPDAVEVAMKYALSEDAAHIALAPRIIAHGFWLRSAVYFFLYNVILAFRPQNADSPTSSASVGIGAFNLIHRGAYNKIDGHRSVALRTDEDLALGAVIKKAGFKQVFASGTHLLSVEWYKTLPEMAHGLEKNALAPFRYRFWPFSLAMAAMLALYSGPALGTVLSPGWTKSIFALAWIMESYLFHMTRKYSDVSIWWSLTVPVAAPILGFILVRAAILAAVHGGIQWRDTFYSLRDLRRQK